MPAPGTSGKMPQMRNIVDGQRRRTANARENTVSTAVARSDAIGALGETARYSR